jgi:hypothetical protein
MQKACDYRGCISGMVHKNLKGSDDEQAVNENSL